MKSLLAVLIALIGLFATGLPAAAQTEIIVFGGDVEDLQTVPQTTFTDDYVYGRRGFDPGRNFDPSEAAINAINASRFFPLRGHSPFNFERAVTLNATGESIAEHQLRCQALYESYDLVSDTYLSRSGIPRPCR